MERALRDSADPDEAIRESVAAIHASCPQYDWTGVYLRNGTELVLHSYLGRPSPHGRIPIGEGICGAAAREGRTILVPDVRRDRRYLACSPETRSEIVVPILRDGEVVGEIDIDSDDPEAFGADDRETLEEVARRLAPRLAGPPARGEGR